MQPVLGFMFVHLGEFKKLNNLYKVKKDSDLFNMNC